jgi:amidase
VPCLLGTDFIKDWTPAVDATIITRILEAGGTIEGKAACENMSLWGLSDSSSTGVMHNPYAEGYSAGGSSSGTGVLVARGEVDIGIGGDQAGSIRLPSSKDGLVGMKPTFGLVPYTGIASLEPTLDHVGPMTRTVLDNAIFLGAIAGADGVDDRQMAGCPMPGDVPDYASLAVKGVEGLRIGILVESLDCPKHDPRVSALVVAAAQKLTALGAVVENVSVPFHCSAPDLWAVIGRFSAANSMSGRACGRRQLFMNDLTDKMLPLTQDRLPNLFVANTNTLINGTWGGNICPRHCLAKRRISFASSGTSTTRRSNSSMSSSCRPSPSSRSACPRPARESRR